jgi:uncharacterized membrane protein
VNAISKILIAIGLLVTIIGSLATRYSLNAYLRGMERSAEGGIGEAASAFEMTFAYNTVSIVGCLLLISGVILASLRRGRRP